MPKVHDYRSEAAAEYRKLYRLPAWKKLRQQIILRDLGVCKFCECICVTGQRDHPRLATVDHIKPHEGDEALFWDPANLQLLCAVCHSGAKQSAERRGFSRAVDAEGYAIDPRHPSNIADRKR